MYCLSHFIDGYKITLLDCAWTCLNADSKWLYNYVFGQEWANVAPVSNIFLIHNCSCKILKTCSSEISIILTISSIFIRWSSNTWIFYHLSSDLTLFERVRCLVLFVSVRPQQNPVTHMMEQGPNICLVFFT